MLLEPVQSKPILGTPIDWTRPASVGLAGFWGFNEGAGKALYDPAGSLSATGVGGVSWSGGPSGAAPTFDGSTGYLGPFGSTSTYNFVQNTQVFTLAACFRLSSATARSTLLCTNAGASANKGLFWAFETLGAGAGTKAMRLMLSSGGAIQINCQSPNNSITDTTNWHVVAVTGAGAGNTLAFWQDGVKQATTVNNTFASLSSGNNTNAPFLGSLNSTPTLPFNGSILWLGVWSVTLADGLLAAITSAPAAIVPLVYGAPRSAWLLHAAATVPAPHNLTLLGCGA